MPAFIPLFEEAKEQISEISHKREPTFEAHITLTDVTADVRFEWLPGDLNYLGTKDYLETLQIGSNVIQIFLYVQLNAGFEEIMLLEAIRELMEQDVAF